MIKIGGSEIKDMYFCGRKAVKAYLNGEVVWMNDTHPSLYITHDGGRLYTLHIDSVDALNYEAKKLYERGQLACTLEWEDNRKYNDIVHNKYRGTDEYRPKRSLSRYKQAVCSMPDWFEPMRINSIPFQHTFTILNGAPAGLKRFHSRWHGWFSFKVTYNVRGSLRSSTSGRRIQNTDHMKRTVYLS